MAPATARRLLLGEEDGRTLVGMETDPYLRDQREGAHKSNMHAQGEGREGGTRILRRLRPSSYRAANTGGAAALGGEGVVDDWARW